VLVVPARAFRAPLRAARSSRALAIFYRFTVEDTIEKGDCAHTTLDHTALGEVSGV